jgi:photosystem II stability/assembly factor-like uncharacterized protein
LAYWKNFIVFTGTALLTAGCGTSESAEDTRETAEEIMHMHDVAFDTSGSGDPYIGTHYGLLHVDLDKQEMKWQSSPEERHDFMGFTVLEDGTFLSSGHPDHSSGLDDPLGVMHSDDQGKTWNAEVLYQEVDFHQIEPAPSDQSVLYGFDSYNSTLYRSEDGGMKWDTVNDEAFEGIDLLEIMVHPDDENLLSAASPYGTARSSDGGATWETMKEGTTVLSSAPYQDGHLIYSAGEEEGWFYTEDLGETTEPYDIALPEEPVISLDINGRIFAAGGSEDSFYVSFDGGENWEVWIDKGEPVQET